jgi:GTPase SAR1 family protein
MLQQDLLYLLFQNDCLKLTTCLVKSFGGVGKTTLCRQLAYNLYDKDDFPNVIWLDASQGLNSKLVNILSSHFGREDIEDPVATSVGIVNNTMGKGVIIIDNL